jgi:hypothetical protein
MKKSCKTKRCTAGDLRESVDHTAPMASAPVPEEVEVWCGAGILGLRLLFVRQWVKLSDGNIKRADQTKVAGWGPRVEPRRD